jgi:hypothetical protein
MFPFSIQFKKRIVRKTNSSSQVMDYLERFVLENNGDIKEKSSDHLKFKTGFIIWNWKLFSFVDKGVFIVNEQFIIFKISMYKLFIVTTFMSLLAFIATKNISVGLLAFVMLCIGNWLTTIYKCYNAFERTISEIEQNQQL